MPKVEEVCRICGKCYKELDIITPIFEIVEENGEEIIKTHIHNDKFIKSFETKLKIIDTLEEEI